MILPSPYFYYDGDENYYPHYSQYESQQMRMKRLQQERLRQQQRLRKQQQLYEQQRLLEQQRLRKQQQLYEQQRLLEQQRLRKQQQLYEQQRLLEQQQLLKEQRLCEMQRRREQQILMEKQRLMEQQQLREKQVRSSVNDVDVDAIYEKEPVIFRRPDGRLYRYLAKDHSRFPNHHSKKLSLSPSSSRNMNYVNDEHDYFGNHLASKEILVSNPSQEIEVEDTHNQVTTENEEKQSDQMTRTIPKGGVEKLGTKSQLKTNSQAHLHKPVFPVKDVTDEEEDESLRWTKLVPNENESWMEPIVLVET